MSASANQGSSWLDVAVPIGPNAQSTAQQSNSNAFNDGSFTFASSPNPGLTAGLSNLTGGAASIGSGIGNLLTSAGGSLSGSVVPILLVVGLVWIIKSRK